MGFIGKGEGLYLNKISGFEICEDDNGYTDAQFASLAEITTRTQAAALKTNALEVFEYTNNTGEATKNTGNLGYTYKLADAKPSLQFGMLMGLEDYKDLIKKDGRMVYIMPYTQNQNIKLGTRKADGLLHGFRAKMFTRVNAPQSDDAIQQNSYVVDLEFQSSDEWAAMEAIDISFDFSDVLATLPIGLSVKPQGAYTSGTQNFKVTNRGTQKAAIGYENAADWRIVTEGTDVTSPTITPSKIDDFGNYAILAQKGGTPVNLAAGEKITVQCIKLNGAKITHVSNEFTIIGV